MAQSNVIRYLFLRIYSNEELQSYLNEQLQKGLLLDHCKGNNLFFRRQTLKNARIYVVTTECNKPKAQEDDQVNEYIEIAAKKGWQLLCIGDIENLIPMRRRLYFYTTDAATPDFGADEAVSFQNAHRANRSTLLWTILWLLATAFLLTTSIPFMKVNGLQLSFLVLAAALMACSTASMCLYFDRHRLYRHITKGTPISEQTSTALRRGECFLLYSMAAICVGMLLLLLS